MPKFLLYGSYTQEGYVGLLSEGGSKRFEAARKAIEGLGGTIESFYFALGENDFYVTVNLPDSESAAAFTLAGNKSGAFHMQSVALLSPEEMDKAAGKDIKYRAPGQS